MAASPRDQLKCVTKRQPTEQEIADCLFAWTVAKHVKSNAIVYAKDGVTAGIGAGQMNRRDSARIAADPRRAKRPRPMAGPSRARSARRSPPTPSSPSPTACWRRSKPARRRSSSPADRSATTRSSPPPTRRAWRCCSPECATSGISLDDIVLDLVAGFGRRLGFAQLAHVVLPAFGTARGPRARSPWSTAPRRTRRGSPGCRRSAATSRAGIADERADDDPGRRRPDERPSASPRPARRASSPAAAIW